MDPVCKWHEFESDSPTCYRTAVMTYATCVLQADCLPEPQDVFAFLQASKHVLYNTSTCCSIGAWKSAAPQVLLLCRNMT